MKIISPLMGLLICGIIITWVLAGRGEDKINPQLFLWLAIVFGGGYFAFRAWKNRR